MSRAWENAVNADLVEKIKGIITDWKNPDSEEYFNAIEALNDIIAAVEIVEGEL